MMIAVPAGAGAAARARLFGGSCPRPHGRVGEQMFTVKQIVAACSDVLSGPVVSLETNDRIWKLEDLSEMSKWLSAMPIEEFRVVAAELMRKVCSYRLPRPDRAYFKFEVESDCSYALYGRWIG